MKVLAIEVSSNICSVSLSNSEYVLLGNITTYGKVTHTEQLWKNIDSLFSLCNCSKSEIKEIIVGAGPGSWTGLRIGVTAAKSIALSLSASLFSISSLDVLAAQVKDDDKLIISLLDAKKKEVYFALYTNKYSGEFKKRSRYLVDKPENVIGYIKKTAILVGSGALAYKEFFLTNTDEIIFIPDEEYFHSLNANLLIDIHKKGLTSLVDIDSFEPLYIRKPDIIKKSKLI